MPWRSKTFPQTLCPEACQAAGKQDLRPRTAWVELAAGYALIEAALWTEGVLKLVFSLAATLAILVLVLRRRPSAQELGLGVPTVAGILWTAVAAAILASAVLFGGWVRGTWDPAHPRWPPFQNPHVYAVWTLAQQFVLQSFVYLRLEAVLRSGKRAVLAAGLLFSAAHMPNPALIVATFAGGLFFCEGFRRYRNIYPIAVAHTVLGFAVAEVIPLTFLHHMRVGIGFLHSR